jgi:ATP-dependent Lon protease
MKKNINDIKLNSIPLLVTRSSVVFPGFVLERVVDRKKSLLAIKNASLHKTAKNFIVVISQKDPKENNPLLENIYNVGTLCFLKEVKDNENNSSKTVKLEGVERVFLQKIFDFKDHYAVNAEIIPSKKLTTRQNNQIVEKLKNSLHIFSELYGAIPISVVSQINASFNSDNILNALAHFLPNISFLKKQKLLEETDPQKRMLILLSDIISKQKIGSLERDIDNKVNNKINEQQKEYILRERLKAIKDELNEIEGKNSEMKVYLKRLETEPFPEDMKIRLKEEIERYESMPQFSSEASTLRTYIKIMMELP